MEKTKETIEYITDTLNECREYMDDKADVDVDNDYFIPNKEAKLLGRIDATLEKIAGYNFSQHEGKGQDEEIKKLKDLLVKYEQWEADIISNDAMWWPNKAKDSLPDEIYNTMLELQSERNTLLKRFTPESYQPPITKTKTNE